MASWLITGGTGSFGKAFARRLLDTGASRVVILSRDELKQAEMAAEFGDRRLRFLIGSVADAERVELAMRGVENVVHAAAMKRIDTCEANPSEAVETNLIGTGVVARAAIAAGVRKAVFLSTDKAAAPNTLYGATKLCAERLWVQSNVYAAGTATRFSATRYGNVLGSRGSVVPIFRSQAEAGELTVTDERMTRFYMPMSAAVDLVLLAFKEMRGGEVFVPKIQAASILTMAQAIAPGVPHRVIGVRPGEKLHETLISEDEARVTRDRGAFYVIEPERTWEDEWQASGTPMPDGFVFRSDMADRFTVEELRGLVA